MATYRCSVCGSTVRDDTDIPVCDTTSRCGLLFDTEIVSGVAPTKRSVKFHLIGEGHHRGDERSYEVVVRGSVLGLLEREPGIMIDPVDESKGYYPDGWTFAGPVGQGSGRTRYAAVVAAYEGGAS